MPIVDRAVHLALDEQRVDHRPAVVQHAEAPQVDLARLDVDLDLRRRGRRSSTSGRAGCGPSRRGCGDVVGLVDARRLERRLDHRRAGGERQRVDRVGHVASTGIDAVARRGDRRRRRSVELAASASSMAAATVASLARTSRAASTAELPPTTMRAPGVVAEAVRADVRVALDDGDVLDPAHAELVGDDLGDARVVAAARRRDAGEHRDVAGRVHLHRRGVEAADERAGDVGRLGRQLEGDADAEQPALGRAAALLLAERRRSRAARAPCRAARGSRPSRCSGPSSSGTGTRRRRRSCAGAPRPGPCPSVSGDEVDRPLHDEVRRLPCRSRARRSTGPCSSSTIVTTTSVSGIL